MKARTIPSIKARTIPCDDLTKPWWVLYHDGVEYWYDIGFDTREDAEDYAEAQYDNRKVIRNPNNK